jgi:hypothetical protein
MRRVKVAIVWEKVGGQKVLGEKWRAKSGNMEMFGTKSSTEN